MLTLIQYPSAFDLPNLSPFCIKAEILLKLANVKYTVEYMNDARKMPTGKLPVLKNGERIIADSECIRLYLEREHNVQFDEHLSPAEVAIGHAFARMCDERLYWVLLYSRWIEDHNWPKIKQNFFGDIPWPGNAIVPNMVRKQIRKSMDGHGIGRHPVEVIYDFGSQDIRAINDYLADKIYFMGDIPSTIDATIYAFLTNILSPAFSSPLRQAAEQHPSLKQYCIRMQTHFFGQCASVNRHHQCEGDLGFSVENSGLFALTSSGLKRFVPGMAYVQEVKVPYKL